MLVYPQRKRKFAYDVAKQYQDRKRRRILPGTSREMYYPKQRAGYSSVPRTRGAQVTGEMKYFDQEVSATALVASADWTVTEFDPGATGTLFVPVVGAAVNQRIGKACKVFKIKINGNISVPPQTNQVATDASCQVRMILVQDLQTNSAQAQGEQVMTAPTTATAALATTSFQNINNFGRFKVLKDKTFVLQNPSITFDGTNIEQSGLIKPFKIGASFKLPVQVRFNATNGGTIADIVDNSWHLIINTTSINLAPVISYNCRVCYKE